MTLLIIRWIAALILLLFVYAFGFRAGEGDDADFPGLVFISVMALILGVTALLLVGLP